MLCIATHYSNIGEPIRGLLNLVVCFVVVEANVLFTVAGFDAMLDSFLYRRGEKENFLT